MSISDFVWLLIVGLGSLSAFVCCITSLAEDGVSSESKEKLKNIVRSYRSTPAFRHTFLTFTMSSDVFFGENVVSLKAFFRSSVLSVIWILIVAIVCIILFPEYRSWLSDSRMSGLFLQHGVKLIAVVIVLDYMSVSTTRIIVKKTRPNGVIKLFSLLVLDLLASVFIFYFGFSAAKYIIVNPSWLDLRTSLMVWLNIDQLPIIFEALNDLTMDMLQEKADGSIMIKGGWSTEVVYAFPEGIAFYSSLLTSVWLWLHTISYILFKISLSFDGIKLRLLSITNMDRKPFKSLGVISVIIYMAMMPVIILIYLVIRKAGGM